MNKKLTCGLKHQSNIATEQGLDVEAQLHWVCHMQAEELQSFHLHDNPHGSLVGSSVLLAGISSHSEN